MARRLLRGDDVSWLWMMLESWRTLEYQEVLRVVNLLEGPESEWVPCK